LINFRVFDIKISIGCHFLGCVKKHDKFIDFTWNKST